MWPNASITDAGVSGLRASALRRWRTNPSREARSAARRVQPGRRVGGSCSVRRRLRSEEHTSELQSLMRISYAVFCLKKKIHHTKNRKHQYNKSMKKKYH